MGVQELPDGEPNPLTFQTLAAYAKAYIDWALERRWREIEQRIAALEKASGAQR